MLRWPAEDIWEQVEPKLPGFSVEVVPEIDSTNSELMRRARASAFDNILLVTERQTAGRGRLGRSWASDGPAESVPALTFSIGLSMAPADWSGLSLAVGLSIVKSLDPGHLTAMGIKWPNDIWLGDRKLAGILIETTNMPGDPSRDAKVRYVVVGVGINVAPVWAPEASTAPACFQEVEAGATPPDVLARIVPGLIDTLQAFERDGFAPLREEFNQRDLLKNREITISDGTAGTAMGVGDDGALLVHTQRGMQSITSSEVSVRPVVS